MSYSSEDEYEYEYSDDDYNSGGGSDDEVDEVAIKIENTFYEADEERNTNKAKAVAMFEEVVKLETEQGEEVKWRFKALQHAVTLHFQLGNNDAVLARYEEMLKYMDQVTSNELQEAINSIMDTTSSSNDTTTVAKVYDVTLAALKRANIERLWFSVLVRKGKLHLAAKQYGTLSQIISQLHESCRRPDGSDDPSKGNYLMEMYALDIQHATAVHDTARMKVIYPKVAGLSAAISDPRINGIVRESFGRMHMSDKKWEEAYNDFYKAFRSYQEAGNSQAKVCLKYVVLANLLALSPINPFDSPEAKVFKDDPEVQAMMQLREAYRREDAKQFESILRDKRNRIMEDELIRTNLGDLLRGVRGAVIVQTVKPYKTVKLAYLAAELNIEQAEVESLLVALILDGKLDGKIDQINGLLRIGRHKSGLTSKKYTALSAWASNLDQLRRSLAK